MNSKYSEIAKKSHKIKTIDEFKELMSIEVHELLGHEMAVCGIGNIKTCRVVRLINLGFPNKYLRYAVHANQTIQSNIVHQWLEKQEPVIYCSNNNYSNIEVDSNWLNIINSCGIKSIISHGLIDPYNQSFMYFAFGNVKITACWDVRESLLNLVPYLYYSLTRAISLPYRHIDLDNVTNIKTNAEITLSPVSENISLLSLRELEVLSWIAIGKKNVEIAQILDISQHTVSNHIKRVFSKLDVTSRAQAITKANNLSLIPNHY